MSTTSVRINIHHDEVYPVYIPRVVAPATKGKGLHATNPHAVAPGWDDVHVPADLVERYDRCAKEFNAIQAELKEYDGIARANFKKAKEEMDFKLHKIQLQLDALKGR